MVTRLPELTRALEAEDPIKLVAEIARLRKQIVQLEAGAALQQALLRVYRDVPISVAKQYRRKGS